MTDNYQKWCLEKGFTPLFSVIMGSTMFGTDTKHSDVDIHAVHLQPAKDYLDFSDTTKESWQFEDDNEYQSMDLRMFIKLVYKGNFLKTIMLLLKPHRVYSESTYDTLKMFLIPFIPREVGKSVFGMINNNYMKYILNRDKYDKEHYLVKKLFHIFSVAEAYAKLLDEFKNIDPMKQYMDFKVDMDNSLWEANFLLKLKENEIDIPEHEIPLWGNLVIKIRHQLQALDSVSDTFKPRVPMSNLRRMEDWLVDIRLAV